MELILNSNEPIFIQVARMLEDEILEGGIKEEDQVPSINEFAKLYRINPATVLKGINLLVSRKILYKKRGIGMFVKKGAKEIIREERIDIFKHAYVESIIKETQRLGISMEELIKILKNYKEKK